MKKRKIAPIVPDKVVGENGNINISPTPKQCYQCLKWCFTYNNYPENYKILIEPRLNEICEKYVFGKEVGESGTPHLQGSIWLLKKMRWSEFKLPIEISWSVMRNEPASIKYCQKDGDVTIKGFVKPLKIIANLYPWQKKIEDLLLTEPDGRSIHWYYEETGNIGKSAFCKYMAVTHNTLVIQGGKLGDIMNIIFNTNMHMTDAVIIDVPRNNTNNVSYNSIECILNGMITNTKYETGRKVFNPPHVVIFSNYPPDKNKLSNDRWKITHLV